MDFSLLVCIFIPSMMCVVICICFYYQNKRQMQKNILQKIRMKKEGVSMNNMIQKYIGKECLIYTFNSQITGIVESLEDNWISVKDGDNSEIINIDYVSRIREYPKKKNGKKKSLVVD